MSPAVVRAPVAMIGGIISPLLLYLVALRLIGQPWPALIAALVLGLAPMQLVLSRQALDYVADSVRIFVFRLFHALQVSLGVLLRPRQLSRRRRSVLVIYVNAGRIEALSGDGWRVEQVINDADNRPAAAILRKAQ